MKKLLLWCCCLWVLASSCNQMTYAPNPDVIAPITHKGQLQASGSVGYGSTSKYQGSLGYGLLNNAAIYGTALTGNEQAYASASAGAFLQLKHDVFVDLYGGYGKGRGYSHNYVYTSPFGEDQEHVTYYRKIFGVGGIHKYFKKSSLSATLAINAVSFEKILVYATTQNGEFANDLLELNPAIFPEFGIRYALNMGPVDMHLGSIIRAGDFEYYEFHPINIYFGLTTDLSKFFGKNKNSRKR